jgi:Ca-activated chloride channel family protein
MIRNLQYFLFFTLILAQDIGYKMYQNNDFESSVYYYKKLLENKQINNLKDEITFNLATILAEIDSLDSAKNYFEQAISDSTYPNSNLYYNYAYSLYSLNDLNQSLENFKKALIEDPSNNEARMNYEFIKNQLNQSNPPPQGIDNQNPTDNQEKNDEEKPSNRPDKDSNNEKKDDQSNKSQNNSNNNPQENSKNENNEFQSNQNSENLLNALKENEKVNKKRKQNTYPEGSLKSW